MSSLTITSDGTPEGTKVKAGDDFIKKITKIDVYPNGKELKASITIIKPALELELKNTRIECPDDKTRQEIQESIQNAVDELNKEPCNS